MRRITIASALLSIFALATPANADVLADWTFENIDTILYTGPDYPIPPGMIPTDPGVPQVYGGGAKGHHTSPLTAWSSPAGYSSPKSFSSDHWAAITDHYQFQTSTTGYSGITIAWNQSRSSTGPATFKLEWSIDGVGFTQFGPIITVPTSWGTFTTPGPPTLDNQSIVYFRITATVGGGATGTSRVDNIVISGTPPTGACCSPTGGCTTTTKTGCTSGIWLGAGVPCTPNSCVPCTYCGPWDHFVDNCASGNDYLPSSALVGIDLDMDTNCLPDTDLIMRGPVKISRSAPYPPLPGHPDTIDTEIVSMSLTSGGYTLTAGFGLGHGNVLGHSLGKITEQTGDPAVADSFFDVFFEVDMGGGVYAYNQTALHVQTTITCITPYPDYIHVDPDNCIELWSSPIPGTGFHLANLVSPIHDAYPYGACCFPDGTCQTTTTAYVCAEAGGVFEGTGQGCHPNLCPQPATGACCHVGGGCTVTTQANCLAPDEWHPEWTYCDPDPCPKDRVVCEPQGGVQGNPFHPPTYWYDVTVGNVLDVVCDFHVQVLDSNPANYTNWTLPPGGLVPWQFSVHLAPDGNWWASWWTPGCDAPLGAGSTFRFQFDNPTASTYGHWRTTYNGTNDPNDLIVDRSENHATEADGNGYRVHVPAVPEAWYWKDYNGALPDGFLPDYDQRQDFDGDLAEDVGYCGPTAVANSIWWFHRKFPAAGVVPAGWTDIDLIQDLAERMGTNNQTPSPNGHVGPYAGTYSDDMQSGIDDYLQAQGVSNLLYEHTEPRPSFAYINAEVQKSQDVTLLVGFWHIEQVQQIGPGAWWIWWKRVGGHFLTVAGVDPLNNRVALSDPDGDFAEHGFSGVVRPAGIDHDHDGDSDPATTIGFRNANYDHAVHNSETYASHDYYTLKPSFSPGGQLALVLDGDPLGYGAELQAYHQDENGGEITLPDPTEVYEYFLIQNGYPPPVVCQYYAEVEAAIVVSPFEACGPVVGGTGCKDVVCPDPNDVCLPKKIKAPNQFFPSLSGTDVIEHTTGYITIQPPSGSPFTYTISDLAGPNSTTVIRQSPAMVGNHREMETEITQMQLHALGGGGGGAVIRESPTLASVGHNYGAATPSATDYPADSFFDLFVEVDIPGLSIYGLHNVVPIPLSALDIMAVPPYGSTYVTSSSWQGVELLNAIGDPTGYSIVQVVHELPPPTAQPSYEVIDCECIDPNYCHINWDGIPFCVGGCPTGQECQEIVTIEPNGSAVYECQCVTPPCEPEPSGLNCAPIICPDPMDVCLPKKIRHNLPDVFFPPAGTDVIERTTGAIIVQTPPPTEFLTYTISDEPPNITRVIRKSPVDLGDRREMEAEITEMELRASGGGGGGGGGIQIRESPTRASAGGNHGAVSATTDYPADSFFDLFVEIDIPDLGVYGLYNDLPILLTAEQITQVPPLGSHYATLPGWPGVDLLGQNGLPTGYRIAYVFHELPPATDPPPPDWEVIECVCIDPNDCHITGGGFSFFDGFEDGNIADWTVTTAGGGWITPTQAVPNTGLWSLEMNSMASGDRATAVTPAVVANQLDMTQTYTVEFDFYLPDEVYHYFEVVATNKGPTLADSQVLLVMDTPDMNELIYRTPWGTNVSIAFLNPGQWYHFLVTVRPPAGQYDVLIDGGVVANVVNIPFALANTGFTGARVGDRNDESGGFLFDYGHAYWDNFSIIGAEVPTCVGGCPPYQTCWQSVTTDQNGDVIYECQCVQITCATCLGDVDGDDDRDGRDIQDFVECVLAGGISLPCACADMDGDLSVTMADVGPFVDALINSTGACP